jgi:2-oxoisovalerate dehydrogenase E2 component (dihydrolipoyl transacylase)
LKLAGAAGDIVVTGTMLAEFEIDASMPQRAEGQDTGHHHAALQSASVGGTSIPTSGAEAPPTRTDQKRDDAGTVVGAMQSSDAVRSEAAIAVGGVKAMPAVRAMARKLGVDLARVRATGADGVATMDDVKRAAAEGTARTGTPLPPAGEVDARSAAGEGAPPSAPGSGPGQALRAPSLASGRREEQQRTQLSATGKPMRTQSPGVSVSGQPEQLKGVRRNMARVMADAHAKVVPTTLTDDADIQSWAHGNDMTARLVRAICVAAKAVPALNAWFDGETLTRTLHPHVDIGIAVDTDDGLFVPALRNADMLDARGVREAIGRLRAQVEDRSIPPGELSGYTISLSNFGMFAGRYATPVVVPPCVAIVAAGRARHQITPMIGGFESHKVIPLSLTFDHRVCTGGEAARFLRAMLDDLALPG